MMTFPLDGKAVFVVIEPGNINRLKQGKPLRIGNDVLVAYVPDMAYFAQLLGTSGELPEKGTQRIECNLRLTPEQIDSALKLCQNRKEVLR